MRLGMKQLVPTSLDEYIAEHKEGDVVTGRIIEVSGGNARVELGEGVQATCRIPDESEKKQSANEAAPTKSVSSPAKADLSSLGSMLQARWKSGPPLVSNKPETLRPARFAASASQSSTPPPKNLNWSWSKSRSSDRSAGIPPTGRCLPMVASASICPRSPSSARTAPADRES